MLATPAPAPSLLTGITQQLPARRKLGLQNIHTRFPQPTDDTATGGHQVGDLWLAPASPRIWKLVNGTTGAAVWAPQSYDNILPVDAVGTSSLRGAYGMVKLRAAYAGNCLQVIRASDSTTANIGFVPQARPDGSVVYVADMATLLTFIAGTTGAVSVWYDQSGNANDAVQTVAANRPVIGVTTVNGIPTVTFDGETYGSNIVRYLSASTGSVPMRGQSVYVAGLNCWSLLNNCAVQYSTNVRLWLAYGGGGYIPSMAFTNNASSLAAPTSPAVFAWIGDSTPNMTTWANNQSKSAGGLSNSSTYTGFLIGGDNATGFQMPALDMMAVLVYGVTHTSTQIETMRATLAQACNIPPQRPDAVVVTDGDSTSRGVKGTYLHNRTFYERPFFSGRAVRQYNIGTAGNTFALRIANQVTLWQNIYEAGMPLIIDCINCGTNDLAVSGLTGAQVFSACVSYAQYIKGLGSNVRVVVSTVTPRSDYAAGTSVDNERLAFNALLRAGNPAIDAVCDLANHPVMGVWSNTADTSLYADGLHPTSLGYSYFALAMQATLAPLLAA